MKRFLRLQKQNRLTESLQPVPMYALSLLEKYADAMGLAGLSYEAAQIAVDKMLMKTKYEEYGVRTALLPPGSLHRSGY